MTETNGDTAEAPERDGEGLFASSRDALPQMVWGNRAARWQGELTLREQHTALTELVDRIELSKKLAMVVSRCKMGNIERNKPRTENDE